MDYKYWTAAAFLVAAVLAAFFPVFFADYVHIDDPQHFWNNPLVMDHGPGALRAIFFTPDSVNNTYVPLTLLSFYLESLFFGADPFFSHLVNLFLHYMVVLFVMTLGRRLGLSLKAAFAAALIFAVHPMHVESVAWVTERKDVLYSFFYLAALIFYIQYLDRRSGEKYILALVCGGLSVLAKPMALSLPLVLFLMDLLKERKISWTAVLDKAPFFLVVEPVALITYAMNARGVGDLDLSSFFVIVWSATFYVQKFFLPYSISFFLYEAPLPVRSFQVEYLKAFLILGVMAVLVFFLRRQRWVWFAVLYYAFSTFFLWRFDGKDAHFVADRFMYLPSLGFCLLAGYLFERCAERAGNKQRLLFTGACLLAVLLMAVTFTKARAWKNTFTIFMESRRSGSKSLQIARDLSACLRSAWCVDSCCKEMKQEYFHEEVVDPAKKGVCDRRTRIAFQILSMKEARKILAVHPANTFALVHLGGLYWEWGGYDKAVLYFKRSTALLPKEAGGYYMLGLCYEGKKDLGEAMSFFDRAVLLDPRMPEVYVARSRVAAMLDNRKKAVTDVLKLIELKPNDPFSYDHAIRILGMINEPGLLSAVEAMKRKRFSSVFVR